MDNVDYVLAVGCNETLMYTFYKYQAINSPPILAFSVGGDSTLYNFNKCSIEANLKEFVNKLQSSEGINKNIEDISKI